MRKVIVAIAMGLLLVSAVPAQASADWFDRRASQESSQSNHYPGLWNNLNFNDHRFWSWRGIEQDRDFDRDIDRNRTVVDEKVEKIIETGMKYWGTPYVFGSDRDTTRTFDCSDFVRQIFKEAVGVTLPSNSRTQGDYVRELGNDVDRISGLQRGDLMFFMKYKGSDSEDYEGINKSKQRITHVGVYLGDGKILHTYSKKSGGVKTNQVTGTVWEYRFLFGGSALE